MVSLIVRWILDGQYPPESGDTNYFLDNLSQARNKILQLAEQFACAAQKQAKKRVCGQLLTDAATLKDGLIMAKG